MHLPRVRHQVVSGAGTAADRLRIERYLGGDESAFREIESWVRQALESRYPVLRQEVEDLCQATHEKLVENLRALRFQHRSTLRTYVVGITHHTAIDRVRKLYRELPLPLHWDARDAGTTDNPYRSLAALEERQLLHQVVQRSSPACRELWRLVFLDQLSYVETGRRLGIPPGTVKSRMWHCRRKALLLLHRLGRAAGVRKRGN
jgi:RNA polymerase sigma-70 factor (ECF subfamily)